MPGQIFISYCHCDGDFAENLASKLKENGLEIWMDEIGLAGGDEWRDEIDKSIRDSSALVLIVTPESKISSYVTYEWIFALGAGLKVVPIKLKETDPHPRLREIHHHDFTNRRARPWEKLIVDLKEICAKEQRKISDTIVAAKQACSIEIPNNCSPIIEMAIMALDSVTRDERRDAIDLLAHNNQPLSKEVLLSAMKKHPLNDVRSSIALELGKIGDKDAVPGLIEALRDTGDLVRYRAVDALGEIGDKVAVPELIYILKDTDISIRLSAARALGKIGDKEAVPRLIEALRDTEYSVRYIAAEALGKIGDKAAVAGLMEALRDPDNSVKEKAVEALGKIVDKDEVPRLIEVLKDPYNYVREVAAWCLGNIGDKAAVAGLMEALRDPDNSVRGYAAEALGKIGDRDAVPGLMMALKGNDESVREDVEKALEKLGVMLDVKTQN